MAAEKGRIVCVTGAGGFIGSWLVKLLLANNYTVHGTVRNPQDEKYAHLKNLEKASENLKLFKADLLDYESLRAAIVGCDGVFHTASPVPPSSVSNPEVELIKPAVDGTLNVLKACCEVNVKKVLYVSSAAAIAFVPNRPQDQPMDESFWSDQELCRSNNWWIQKFSLRGAQNEKDKKNGSSKKEHVRRIIQEARSRMNFKGHMKRIIVHSPTRRIAQVPAIGRPNLVVNSPITDWYCLSKTKAESEGWEFSKRNGIDFLSVCPTLVVGPMLQKTVNASNLAIIKLLKEGYEELENRLRFIVDVRDLAEALIFVYENPEASGRYICTSHLISSKDLVEILKKHYPDYKYPKKFTESKDKSTVTSQKLQELGWSYRPLEETLVDSVENYAQNGLLGKD